MARLTVATCMGLAVTLGLGLGLFMRRELSALAKEYHRSAADAASAAARIRLSEDKANAILESITDGFFTLDIEWRYVYVNAAAERYNSKSREETLGRVIWELFPGAAGTKLESEYRAAVADGKPRKFENHYLPWDRWFSINVYPGRDGGLSVYFRDITEARTTTSALRDSERRFRAAVEAVSSLLWTNNAHGMMEGQQPQWGAFTGQTFEEYQGYGWSKAVHPDDSQPTIDAWERAVAASTVFNFEHRVRRRDGEWRLCAIRAVPVMNDDGIIHEWVGVHTDLTEQRAAGKHLAVSLDAERAARAEAERAGRLKDKFLTTLSHELRTPLNAILGWSQMLRKETRLNEDVNEGLGIIERNARVQAQLIEDLLDMSRIISGKVRIDVQDVNIADITNASIEAVRPAADAKGIRLEKVLDTHFGTVRGDPVRLQQVVWNLLANAVKFTPKGGKVQVSLQRINSHVEIVVTDTGAGIKGDFIPYVFERFRQADGSTKRQHSGLGIGLAIVKNLVELHGGKVRAKSPGEGLGATFIVELPVAAIHGTDADGARVHPGSSVSENAKDFLCEQDVLNGVSVLVVDDEEDARKLIRRVLEECKATVTTAASSADAVELLKSERFSVIVSDIGMPHEDGYDFIQKVRQLPASQGGETPAAALTAFARSEDRTRALHAGYQSHIAKPVEPTELVAVIMSLSRKPGGNPAEKGIPA